MANNRYKTVLEEIETDNVDKAVWLEAFEKANGDRSKAISIYISLRGDQIYRDQTSVFQRTADTAFKVCDPRTKRGQLVGALITITLLLIIPLSLQPFLRASAARKYQALCEKARHAHVVGENAQYLFRELGEPTSSEANGESLTYVYDPSSWLCFTGKKYQLRFFVDTQSGAISGMQEPMLLSESGSVAGR